MNQLKLVFVILQNSFFLQLSQFTGQGASVYGQIVCQFLSVKRNHKIRGTGLHCLPGEVGQELFSCCPFDNMLHFLGEQDILFCQDVKHVLYETAMKMACRGAGGNNPFIDNAS